MADPKSDVKKLLALIADLSHKCEEATASAASISGARVRSSSLSSRDARGGTDKASLAKVLIQIIQSTLASIFF